MAQSNGIILLSLFSATLLIVFKGSVDRLISLYAVGVFTTVIIPTFVPRIWWESFLHNQTALFLKTALRKQKSRVVTSVRYYL
ncbi:MAG: hypothetical protein V7K97_30365 [Nostoc sp.]|uniref:hypothetical protein n=1 Tax=Nostoc sp. TaxID=1180 RepID=UPI002FF89082